MDEKVKLAIIGCGAIAKQYHMPVLKSIDECSVVAVCDLIPERAEYAASFFGISRERVFTDAAELLKIEEIQGVVILTPNYNHCEMTELAAIHKKHVFCTKPMARSVEECQRMIDACEKNNVQLFISFMHRYLNGIEEAKRLIETNYIGDIQMVRVLNAPGATSTVSKWFYKKENVGGGCVMDIGVHGIDLVRYLIGDISRVLYADIGCFRSVIESGGEKICPDNEDHAAVMYQTESGALVDQMISWHHWTTADRFSMEIFGSQGTILLRGTMGQMVVAKVKPGQGAKWVSQEVAYNPLRDREHRDFINMIKSGSSADPDGYEGLACVKVAKAVYRAAEIKSVVEVK